MAEPSVNNGNNSQIDMDDLDRDILNIIQSHFPITERPYQNIGQQVGLDETEILDRVARLKDKGIIRRIGGNVNSNSVGYSSTLCAASVPDDKFDLFVNTVNSHPGVTHNYLRRNKFNVWFTFIAESEELLQSHLDAITAKTGVPVLSLPSIKTFKIQVDFPI